MSDPVIIIFGATGGLGQYIIKECKKRNLEFIGVNRNVMNEPTKEWMHESNASGLRRSIVNMQKCGRAIFINTIGWGDVQGCQHNPYHSYGSNAMSVGKVLYLAMLYHTHMIHVSTNDVFGQPLRPCTTGHKPQSDPKPIGTYAQHKYIGEQILQATYDKDHFAIVRATFMSPWSRSKGGETFYYEAYKKFKGAQLYDPSGLPIEVVKGYTNQGTCPISVDTYAKILVDLALQKATGIHHFSTSDSNFQLSRHCVLEYMKRVIENEHAQLFEAQCMAEGPRESWLSPMTHDIETECKKFVKLCEEYDKGKS